MLCTATVQIVEVVQSVKSGNAMSFHDSVSRNCCMDVLDLLYLCSWEGCSVHPAVGINELTAPWSCACLLEAQKSWRKGQNFKFSRGSKGKRCCVRRSVDIWLPQSVNSMGMFDGTE